jgi:hypothetical protein
MMLLCMLLVEEKENKDDIPSDGTVESKNPFVLACHSFFLSM